MPSRSRRRKRFGRLGAHRREGAGFDAVENGWCAPTLRCNFIIERSVDGHPVRGGLIFFGEIEAGVDEALVGQILEMEAGSLASALHSVVF